MKALRNYFQSKETPFYWYDLELLDQTLQAVTQASTQRYHVHYAIKANSNPKILDKIKGYGLGIDGVSGNEIRIALENGFDPEQIVLAGVGKTDREIAYAIDQGIFSMNVESIQELQVINDIATAKGKKPRVSIRINPAIDAGTHHYITTGSKGNKFGISREDLFEALPYIKSLPSVDFIGVHYHIGSQITDMSRFVNLCERINQVQKVLLQEGFELPHVNVGGGLGINYDTPIEDPIPDFAGFFDVFKQHLDLLPHQEVHFELGRSIVGQCGYLVSRVLYTKDSGGTHFLILDAGMNDLMRPALYQAKHKVISLAENVETAIYDVVGPVCESSDSFAKALQLPLTQRGDLVVICSVGAYGETMKNHYNARDFAQAYYSDELVQQPTQD